MNVAALSNDTPAMDTKKIARDLFTPQELAGFVIDQMKALKPDSSRKAAANERTGLYKQAVRVTLGSRYSPELYKETLKLVNQKSIDLRNKSRKRKFVSLMLKTTLEQEKKFNRSGGNRIGFGTRPSQTILSWN